MKRIERGQCMNRQTLGEIEDDGTPQNYKSDVGVQILCTGMGSRSFGVSDPLRLSTAQYAAERSIYSGMLVPLLPPTAIFFRLTGVTLNSFHEKSTPPPLCSLFPNYFGQSRSAAVTLNSALTLTSLH